MSNVGIVTSRDGFVIAEDKNELIRRIQDFFALSKEEIQSKYKLKENQSWKIEHVKQNAKCFSPDVIKSIAYRPFDERMIYYDDSFLERPRREVVQHFLNGENIGIVFSRQSTQEEWNSIQLSKYPVDNRYHFSYKGIPQQAPLYLYPEKVQQQTLEDSGKRKPNLNPDIVEQIATGLGLSFVDEKEENTNTFAPIDLLDYIYAVLHSPTYRETYREFLKIDFPRIPYPKDRDTFWQLVQLGEQLRQIHLLESPVVEEYITSYPKDGDNIITRKIIQKDWEFYDTDKQLSRIWINDNQYFDQIPLIAWEFYIGGYQPAQKWLKDRVGRKLSYEDILHYQKIIKALIETDRLMKAIDNINIE